MIIVLCLALMLFAIPLIAYQRTTLVIALLILSVALLSLGSTAPLPLWLLNRLSAPYQTNEPIAWKQHNAIVLLGAGLTPPRSAADTITPSPLAYPRIHEAAKQYHACERFSEQHTDTVHSCKVIITGGDVLHTGTSEAEAYQPYLLSLGVNANDIILETRSRNTYENATFTQTLLQRKHFEGVFIITSAYHIARAMLFFHHAGIEATPIMMNDLHPRSALMPSAINLLLTELTLHEYVSMAQMPIYDWMGWNKPAPSLQR